MLLVLRHGGVEIAVDVDALTVAECVLVCLNVFEMG